MCAWIEDQYVQNQTRIGFFISMPTRSFIENNVVGSMLQLRVPGNYGPPTWSLEVGQPIDISRNIAAAKALQLKARYLLFIDSDIMFPADTLERLLSYRLPVVGAAYRSRGPPYLLVANKDQHQLSPEVLKDPNIDLLQVDNIGMGFTLIDTRVLKSLANKLEWRCFIDHTREIKQEVARFDNQQAINNEYKCIYCKKLVVAKFFDYRSGKANKDAVSEDYYFCKLVRDAGYPIHVSTKTFVQHQTLQFLGVDGFESNLKSVGDVQ